MGVSHVLKYIFILILDNRTSKLKGNKAMTSFQLLGINHGADFKVPNRNSTLEICRLQCEELQALQKLISKIRTFVCFA